jgi:hypothetical protein
MRPVLTDLRLMYVMQIAHFLGDQRLPGWIKLAVNLLQRSLSTDIVSRSVREKHIAATEALSLDVLDAVLLDLPLVTTLSCLSRGSHVRAVQVRVHQDEYGPHLVLDVPACFSEEHASALSAALSQLQDDLKPVSVTLKPGNQRVRFPSSICIDDSPEGHRETPPGSQEVQAALLHIAGTLRKLPRLSRLYSSRCSMLSSSLCCFPREHLRVLDVSDNDLGQRFSRPSTPAKRSFDQCLQLTSGGVNTTLQVRIRRLYHVRVDRPGLCCCFWCFQTASSSCSLRRHPPGSAPPVPSRPDPPEWHQYFPAQPGGHQSCLRPLRVHTLAPSLSNMHAGDCARGGMLMPSCLTAWPCLLQLSQADGGAHANLLTNT